MFLMAEPAGRVRTPVRRRMGIHRKRRSGGDELVHIAVARQALFGLRRLRRLFRGVADCAVRPFVEGSRRESTVCSLDARAEHQGGGNGKRLDEILNRHGAFLL